MSGNKISRWIAVVGVMLEKTPNWITAKPIWDDLSEKQWCVHCSLPHSVSLSAPSNRPQGRWVFLPNQFCLMSLFLCSRCLYVDVCVKAECSWAEHSFWTLCQPQHLALGSPPHLTSHNCDWKKGEWNDVTTHTHDFTQAYQQAALMGVLQKVYSDDLAEVYKVSESFRGEKPRRLG